MPSEPDSPTSEHAIRAQLQRLLNHPDFSAPPQRKTFLKYVIEETLAGRQEHIKGVSIAMSVFGRDESFDQQTDPIVRLEARRLRQDLDSYYAGGGRGDRLRISIPKGSYVPYFEFVTTPETASPRPQQSSRSAQIQRRSLVVGAIGIAAAFILSGIYLALMHTQNADVVAEELPRGPVIAVMPFASLGDGPTFVADGITQQLTTELVRFRDLWVLPLGSVARFHDDQTDLNALKSEFDADFVLEGSVTSSVDTLKISARLIDLETDRYVWVRSYDTVSTPEDIYNAQNKITHDVVGNLAGKYGILAKSDMTAAGRSAPENRSAYDCVLEYYSYQITINLERHGEIKACIERAVELEPDYADAWAVLSNLYLQQIRFALGGDPQEIFQAADAAANRAINLDPHSAAAHLMLANVRFVTGDLEGFRQSGSKAVELNPNDNAVLAHYGLRLALSGSWEEGLAIAERAIALNPVHPHWYHFPKVFYHYNQGNFSQALAALDRIKMPGFFWTHLWSAALNAELGNQTAAETSLARLLELRPDFASESQNIFSIWQLETDLKRRMTQSLEKAGLKGKSET